VDVKMNSRNNKNALMASFSTLKAIFNTFPDSVIFISLDGTIIFANKKFTFKNNDKTQVKQFVVFLAITLIGLWVIQPLVISGIELTIASFTINSSLKLIIAKLFATVASLIWNYLMYRRFVFVK